MFRVPGHLPRLCHEQQHGKLSCTIADYGHVTWQQVFFVHDPRCLLRIRSVRILATNGELIMYYLEKLLL